ncbi:MAG: CPBP family intramembrane metalloprotease [Saprospiraceae bacterium]|nr:CPBP family intramembrane metalloprotease [Saprospiraceae bacterium]
MVYQIDNFLIKCNTRLSVIIFVFAIYIFSIIYNITLKLFSINYALDNFRFYDSPIELIFFAIILAPLLETFLFQFLIFKILLNKNIGHYFIIILSAFIFSLVHYPRNNNIFEAVNIFL